jgi:uncharacterized protein (DUF305 family)
MSKTSIPLSAIGLTLACWLPLQAQQPPPHPPTNPVSGAHGHGDAAHLTDAQFVTMMTKHHRDGIEMAKREEANGTSSEVKALAAKIRQSQERELSELQGHSAHAASASEMAAHAEHQKMEQQSRAAMKRLQSASGEALDRAFLEEMAKHHQMAIDMVGRTTFKDADMRQMAQKMAAAQQDELGELKQLQKKTS